MTGDIESRAEAMDRKAADEHDEELARSYGTGERVIVLATGRPPDPAPDLAETFAGLLTPWSDEEIEEARTPWPHVFSRGQTGMYPVGEVTIVAAQGREGKTTVKIGIATALVIGHTLADLWPEQDRSVVIYSAEDDRQQYARKVGAQLEQLGPADAFKLKQRLIVPDLDRPEFAPMRSLVMVLDGQPMVSGTVDAIIEGIRPLMARPVPPGLLIFETASTLSDAEETNPGFRTLILGLRRIARELEVAVVLSHHVSQASLQGLSDLALSTTDIRGGTALVNNSRQCAMLVNLGSDEDPFPETDARTVLRRLAAPNDTGRITAYVTLDSSKSIPPPPIFLRWVQTEFGPAAVEVNPPYQLAGKPWRKVVEIVRAERAARREDAKEERAEATTTARATKILAAVAALALTDEPATSRRIRERAGVSAQVVRETLSHLVEAGKVETFEAIAGRQKVTAYRLVEGGTAE